MDEMPMKKMIEAALENIRKVADADTVIGQPINLQDGVTVVPFSKVSVGFASGGSDLEGKSEQKSQKFAGGNGAGLTVVPLGFIVVSHGEVRVIDLASPASLYAAPAADPVNKTLDMVNGVLDRAPGIIERIKDMLADYNAGKAKPDTDIEAQES